jgi:glycosyltransferase involved in cell wall biosynthesis
VAKKYRSQKQLISRKKLHLPKDKKIVLFVASGGTKNLWKGWKYVQEIMSALHDKDTVFVSIGDTGEEISSQYIQRGAVHDQALLSMYYSAADVLVFPSIADNSPLVIMEAMSCGLSVAAFRIGGIPEIIDHKKNGYLAAYGDAQDLLRGIKYILQLDANERKQFQFSAVRKIKSGFSLDSMVSQYIALYKKLV